MEDSDPLEEMRGRLWFAPAAPTEHRAGGLRRSRPPRPHVEAGSPRARCLQAWCSPQRSCWAHTPGVRVPLLREPPGRLDYGPHFNLSPLSRPCPQIRSHSEVLGVSASASEFGGPQISASRGASVPASLPRGPLTSPAASRPPSGPACAHIATPGGTGWSCLEDKSGQATEALICRRDRDS